MSLFGGIMTDVVVVTNLAEAVCQIGNTVGDACSKTELNCGYVK